MALRKNVFRDRKGCFCLSRQVLTLLILSLLALVLFSGQTTFNTCSRVSESIAPPQSTDSPGNPGENRPAPGSTGNLVFATAAKVPSARLQVFVQSWAEYSPGSQLVIFTEPETLEFASVQRLYNEFSVIAVPFTALPEIDDPDDPEDFARPGRLPMHFMQQVVQYLETKGDGAKAVLVAIDAAGMASQGDPFIDPVVENVLRVNEVLLTLESGPLLGDVTVGQNIPVSRSINACFGSGVLKALEDKPLFNADLVIGSADAVRRYLILISDVMATRVRTRCLRDPRADRAALQYSIQDFGSDLKSLNFRYKTASLRSPVFGAAFGMPAKLDGRGVLHRGIIPGTNRRGPTPALVTQYDAHPMLVRHYLNKYHIPYGDLEFAQTSGYNGSAMVGRANLPVSWERSVKTQYAQLSGDSAEQATTMEQVVDAMLAQQKAAKRSGRTSI